MVQVTDTIHQAGPRSAASSFGERVAQRFIHDLRDVPFLRLMVVTMLTVVASGVLLFVPGMFTWWLAALHLALVVYFLGPFILMLHNTSHRRLFKAPYQRLNYFIPWVIGPFFGESPETYFGHHVAMHHPENNVGDDISTTLDYQRDSAIGFARYFLRFFFLVLLDISRYFIAKRRQRVMMRVLFGELSFFVFVAALASFNWRAAVVVFVVPYLIARFGMMAGNWAQHAFVDRNAPANCYRNSITCINTSYNRRCFNDGYHIGHHIKQTRHWTEMPGDFVANVAVYEKEKAVVFDGIDFFAVWFLLMTKSYGALARRMVQLGDTPQSVEDRIAFLQGRTRWVRRSAEDDSPVTSDDECATA